jgi:glycosyltransferase involved in cell wall biosynthesis
VAAALAGRLLGVPVLITLRGMLPLLMPFRLRRPQLRWALRQADRVIAVAAPLKDDAAALGIPPQKVRVIENGIDADLFRPLDRGEARRALGLLDRVAVSSPLGGGGLEQGGGQEGGGTDGHNPPAPKVLPGCGAPLLTAPLPQPAPSQGGGTSTALAKAPILLSVGTLAPRKGFHLVIEALPALAERFPEIRFAIVGGAGAEGAMERELRDLAARLGVGERVIFAGPQKRGDLAAWYSAADLSVLASAHEGCPNVVLESLACGTPVVATPVGSLPEILKDAGAGLLVERTVPALTAGIAAALARGWDRDKVRARVASRTWEAVGREVLEEIEGAVILTRGTSGRIWAGGPSHPPDPSARNSPQDDSLVPACSPSPGRGVP